ncbi:hypothetical protein [Bacillus cereus]|uniref:hypothetical protein n=1 Tax=Bacillus cereus TaxID=1396 RepID=UPI00065B9EE5|nr:hypothetical protein [Bacillus cereus]KMP94694.1 hypothetical protein TU67_29045 [Bacillus cereus]MED2867986.1 hypothetical protein [Bacillus thuringiensis]
MTKKVGHALELTGGIMGMILGGIFAIMGIFSGYGPALFTGIILLAQIGTMALILNKSKINNKVFGTSIVILGTISLLITSLIIVTAGFVLISILLVPIAIQIISGILTYKIEHQMLEA